MTRSLSGAWLALALAAAPLLAQENGLAAYTDKLLSETYPADGPGAAVLIIQDGKTLLRKGYGLADLELGVPIWTRRSSTATSGSTSWLPASS